MVRRWAWVAGAVGVLVYLNALGNGFSYDDVQIIQENEAIHTWSGLLETLGDPYWPGHYGTNVGVWRPVVTTWFSVQWIVFGGNPALFHLTGILLHGVTSGVVVVLLGSLLPVTAAAIGGLLFAVHPVHVEAVANVIGNADMISALFVLLALLVHMRGGERYGWGRTAGVGALFALGMLTKEGAVVLPGLIFLVDGARRELRLADLPGYLRRRWPVYATLVGVVLALFAARIAILGSVAPEQSPSGATILTEVPRIWTLAGIWPHYLRLLLWPADLAADYGGIVPVLLRWTSWNVLGVTGILFFLVLGLWGWRTGSVMDGRALSRRALGFAVVWFGVAISPVSNVVFVSPVLVAERNLYLPSVAVAAGVGYLLAVLWRERRQVALVLTTVLVLLAAGRTWTRTPLWDNTWDVFADLLERYPEAGRGWFFRGERLFLDGRMAEARRAYSVALGLMESDYAVASLVATRFMAMEPSHQEVAEFLLRRAWAEEPQHYTAPGTLAILHLNQGRFEEGEAPARAAVERAPENADMWRVLAALLSGQGRAAEAIPYRLEALARAEDPSWRWWFWLAEDWAEAGDTAAALAALDTARAEASEVPGAPVTAELDSVRALLTGGAAEVPPGAESDQRSERQEGAS